MTPKSLSNQVLSRHGTGAVYTRVMDELVEGGEEKIFAFGDSGLPSSTNTIVSGSRSTAGRECARQSTADDANLSLVLDAKTPGMLEEHPGGFIIGGPFAANGSRRCEERLGLAAASVPRQQWLRSTAPAV